MFWTVFLVSVPLAALVAYLIWTRNYNYWRKRGIAYASPSFPFGNFKEAIYLKKTLFDVISEIYGRFDDEDVVGMYCPTQPCLLVRDPTLAKEVLIDQFKDFMKAGFEISCYVDPILGQNPFCLNGSAWKECRNIHTPNMTFGKMKNMVADMKISSTKFKEYISNKKGKSINVIHVNKMYMIDTVLKSAYGIESEVWAGTNEAVNALLKDGVFTAEMESNYSAMSAILLPWMNYITKFRFVSKLAFDFTSQIYDNVVLQRKSNRTRNDLVERLLEIDDKREAAGKPAFDKNWWVSNLMVFLLDGIETASIAMSFIMHCIALNPLAQKRLRDEIKTKGITLESFDFEKLSSLDYLEMVIQEALRLYPVIPVFTRIAVKETTLGNLHIPKGMKLMIPVMQFHYDKKLFPNPEEFHPERFSKANKENIVKGSHYQFGAGPRLCLGMNFAKTALKVAIVSLMLDYEFTLESNQALKCHRGSTFLVFPENGVVDVKFSPIHDFS